MLILLQYKGFKGGFVRFLWTPVLGLIAVAVGLGLFQNCSSAVPFGSTDHFQSLVNSPEFPFEVAVDQLAYMSCAEQEGVFNDGTFFTFRIGAFGSGGIRVTPEYRSHINKVKEEEVPSALQVSASSSRLRLQTAVRTLENFQLMYVDPDNGAEGVEGFDFDNFFPIMGDEALVNTLWFNNPLDYVNVYSQALFIDDYRFEGELSFMKSEVMEKSLRDFFGTRGIVAVTFANEGEIFPVGPGSLQDLQDLADSGSGGEIPNGGVATPPPSSSNPPTNSSGVGNVRASGNDIRRDVFGVAVQPRFKQPPKYDLTAPQPELNPGSFLPPRVLSQVSDVIIDERMRSRPMPGWICPSELAFMIVLPSDAEYQDVDSNTITRCSTNQDPVNQSTHLKIARQSIYAEDFYIDMNRRCVVPKRNNVTTGSCYGVDPNTNQTYRVNYDTFHTDGCGFGNINGLCPHYVSVCYRQ